MPIYEYACGKCDHEFEVEQRITEVPVKTCPECRSRRVKRLISQTSFVLKGSGWYSDLYSSPGGKDKQKGKDSGDGAAAESGESKPDKQKTGGDDKSGKSKGKGKGKGKGSKAAA
jgi:putative FmdB family regulatory protein